MDATKLALINVQVAEDKDFIIKGLKSLVQESVNESIYHMQDFAKAITKMDCDSISEEDYNNLQSLSHTASCDLEPAFAEEVRKIIASIVNDASEFAKLIGD